MTATAHGAEYAADSSCPKTAPTHTTRPADRQSATANDETSTPPGGSEYTQNPAVDCAPEMNPLERHRRLVDGSRTVPNESPAGMSAARGSRHGFAIGFEERVDPLLEDVREAERERQAGIVTAGLDGVDGLARDPDQVTELGLGPASGSSTGPDVVVHRVERTITETAQLSIPIENVPQTSALRGSRSTWVPSSPKVRAANMAAAKPMDIPSS